MLWRQNQFSNIYLFIVCKCNLKEKKKQNWCQRHELLLVNFLGLRFRRSSLLKQFHCYLLFIHLVRDVRHTYSYHSQSQIIRMKNKYISTCSQAIIFRERIRKNLSQSNDKEQKKNEKKKFRRKIGKAVIDGLKSKQIH